MFFSRPFRPRGWVLLLCGALSLLLALVLGRRDLLMLAVFCCALPAVTCAWLYAFKPGFSIKRTLSPTLARVDLPVSVTLEVRGRSPGGSRTRLQEELPESVQGTPRFGLRPVEAPTFSYPHPVVPRGLVSRYHYELVPPHRGVFTIGPLLGQFSDPFDIALLQRGLDPGTLLTVAPAAQELPSISLTDGRGQDGSHSTKELAHASHDDAMTREYRYGDPLRRVHWPVTARTGKIMVRAEESVTTPEAALILDRRGLAFGEQAKAALFSARAHRPTDHTPHRRADGTVVPTAALHTTPAFETAVVAAVSIATHLLDRGYSLRILDHYGRAGFASSASAFSPDAEDFSGTQGVFEVAAALAALELAPTTERAPALERAAAPPVALTASATGSSAPGPVNVPATNENEPFSDALTRKLHQGRRRGPLVAVTGLLSDDQARALASTAESAQSAYALLLCAEPSQLESALEILRRAGWQAVALTPQTSLLEAWTQLEQFSPKRLP